MENRVPPTSVLQGRLLPAPPAVDAPDPVMQRAVPINAVGPAGAVLPAPTVVAAVSPRAVPINPAGAVLPAPTFASATLPEQAQATTASGVGGAGGEQVPRHSSGPATAALAQETDERGAHAAGLRQFRLALAVEARRFRRYPGAAERAGLTGTAEVRVTVESGVSARRVDLNRSSGHALLDAAALEMLRQAVPRTALPESLQGRNFVVLLPVVFEVEK
ncbi:MAG: TonB family protein [Rhodocyclaceae bacterium]|nr:TonB family protein [Rhodocyclaceae bacterium]